MRKYFLFGLLIGFCLVLTGCNLTINIDGSGDEEVKKEEEYKEKEEESFEPEKEVVKKVEPTVSDEELIKKAFGEKYDRPVSEIELKVDKKADEYASGGIKFRGEMGGGWFLAAKTGEEWVIVADGNGTVPCEAVEPYDFPVEMVPECYDEESGELRTF